MLALEHSCQGYRLVHVALMRTGGMSVDIVDVIGCHARRLQGSRHGDDASIIRRLTDATSIAGEAIAHYLGEDVGTTRLGMLIILQYERGGTTTRDETVAVAVERTTCLRRLVHANGEGSQGIEGSHRIIVGLLRSTTEHHVLQSLLNHHETQTDGVTATGACRAHREVDATEMEDGAEVHVHRRIHRLEDESIAQHRRVVLLVHNFRSLDNRFRR